MEITTFTKTATRVVMTTPSGIGDNSVSPQNYNVTRLGTEDIIIQTANDPNVSYIFQGKYYEMSLNGHGNIPSSQNDAWVKLTTYYFI